MKNEYLVKAKIYSIIYVVSNFPSPSKASIPASKLPKFDFHCPNSRDFDFLYLLPSGPPCRIPPAWAATLIGEFLCGVPQDPESGVHGGLRRCTHYAGEMDIRISGEKYINDGYARV